jgi:hypothetical protein
MWQHQCISVAKNPVLHSKTKHIEVRYHFLKENVEKGKIAFIHVSTHDQLADIFTKPLDQATFTRLQGDLGVCLISWVGVWELVCSICIAFLYAFLAFGMTYVTWCIGILVSYSACILYHMHFVGNASLIYIVHHDVLYMILWASMVCYG